MHHSDIRLDDPSDDSSKQVLMSGYPGFKKGDRVEFLFRPDEKWGRRATNVRLARRSGGEPEAGQ